MRRRLVISAPLVLGLVALIVAGTWAYDLSQRGVIARGVRVAGVDVGGLDASAAHASCARS